MAERTVKARLQLDGERQFKEAIASSKLELKAMGSELKTAAAEYQLTGDKMELLRKRTDVLTREIAEQEKVIQQTSEMLQKAAAGGEQYTDKFNRLKIELNNSQAALLRMKKELQTADREMEELGRDSLTAGRNIERGVTDSAEEASKELKQMASEMNASIKGIDFKTSFNFAANLAQGAFQLVQNVDQWASASLEYNRKVGMLKTNAEMSGADWENVEAQFLEVAALTGDADAAVEGLSNLLTAGVTDSAALDEMVDLLAGAVTKWPDTLKFESLADSLQETVSKQEATGQFAEMLERMGIDLDDFNTGLQTAQGDTADLNYIMSILASQGLKESYDAYQDINGGIIAAEGAQQRLNHEWQTLGKHVATWLTPVKEGFGEVLATINSIIERGVEIVPGWGGVAGGDLEEDQHYEPGETVTTDAGITFTMLTEEELAEQEKRFAALAAAKEKAFMISGTARVNAQQQRQLIIDQTAQLQAMLNENGKTSAIDIPIDTDSDAALENLSSALDDYNKSANAHGVTIGEEIGAGIDSGLAATELQLRRRMASIERLLTPGNTSTGTTASGTNPAAELVANMQVDGKTFARLMVPYIDREQGKQWKTNLN